MNEKIKSYDVGGMLLKVEVDDVGLLAHVDNILGPFVLSEVREGGFVLHIGRGDPEQREAGAGELRLVWEGVLPAGMEVAHYVDGDVREIELPGKARVRIDGAGRWAKIVVRAGCEEFLGYGCIIPVLCEFLSEADQHVVHAASLCVEDEDGGRAVLLHGESGLGKTTTALSLARWGMNLLADDASVVGRNGGDDTGRVVVWGLPRPCKVHKDTLAMLPHLEELPRRTSLRTGKDLINIDDITGVYKPRKVKPGLIVFLTERNEREHELSRMGKVEALAELTRQNVRSGDASFHRRAGAMFRMMGELARVELEQVLRQAHKQAVQKAGFSLLLRRQVSEIGGAMGKQGIWAMVLKGQDFADRLYPASGLRPYGDVDILVRPSAVGEAEELLGELGYEQQPEGRMKRTSGYGQRSWYRAGELGGTVEIHWNLVNSPMLRRSLSVEFDDLALEAGGGEGLSRATGSSLLLIAAVHGASSHSFDKLRLVCDVRQSLIGAAGELDEDWLVWAARRTGSGLAIAAGVMLAEKTFGATGQERLAELVGQGVAVRLADKLLTASVVLGSQSWWGASRRGLFRELLKRAPSGLS